MQNIFEIVYQLVKESAPHSVENLNPPANEEQLSKLKCAIQEMPDELERYFKLHNGEAVSWISIFPNGMQLIDIDLLIELYSYQTSTNDYFIDNVDELVEKNVMDRPVGPVRPVFQYSKRIPFAQMNGSIIWYVDMDPAEGGNVGQIIEEDAEDLSIRVIANSLSELFNLYIKDLENGAFTTDGEGQIINESEHWPNKLLERASSSAKGDYN